MPYKINKMRYKKMTMNHNLISAVQYVNALINKVDSFHFSKEKKAVSKRAVTILRYVKSELVAGIYNPDEVKTIAGLHNYSLRAMDEVKPYSPVIEVNARMNAKAIQMILKATHKVVA